MSAIDWSLIEHFEGGSRLVGYVPPDLPAGVESGVTVAGGVDLGWHTARGLAAKGVGPRLIAVLQPYLGVQGAAARALMAAQPLRLTQLQASQLDAAMRLSFTMDTSRMFDAAEADVNAATSHAAARAAYAAWASS